MVHSLIYASRATHPMSEATIVEILAVARRNNAARNVTGMLLHHAGSFLQVLEGEEAAVEETYARIARDPRHDTIVLLSRGNSPARGFGEWSMGALELGPESRDLPGINDFLRTGVAGLASPGVVNRVLTGFREGRFRQHVR